MAKYKVLQRFRDKETKEVYEIGQEIEMTVKRADEAIENLKKWTGDFLERVDNKGEEKNEGDKEKEVTEQQEESKQPDPDPKKDEAPPKK